MAQTITIQATINAPVDKVWTFYTEPKHITQWNNASDDWHTPSATNDLRVGGKFVSRMEAKDGSVGFDFSGKYTDVKKHERIAYVMEDGRKAQIVFTKNNDKTNVTVTFDAETQNSIEMQKGGWQAILNNFKKHVERS